VLNVNSKPAFLSPGDGPARAAGRGVEQRQVSLRRPRAADADATLRGAGSGTPGKQGSRARTKHQGDIALTTHLLDYSSIASCEK